MAKLAQERSKRPEILTLAKAIIQSQSQEITQMQIGTKTGMEQKYPLTQLLEWVWDEA